MRLHHLLAAAAVLALDAGPAPAIDAGVDVALVIAGDVSGSMAPEEQRLQRDGFAAAFRHPDVLNVIGSGMTGRIAVTYVEWAGPDEHWIIAPWTIIGNRDDAAAFAGQVAAAPLIAGSQTSLSSGLVFAADQFRSLGMSAIRQTIDISGDGFNSAGPPLAPARQFVLAMGITINGLSFPAVKQEYPGDAVYLIRSSSFDLAGYYQDCVIGGPGGFAMSVEAPEQFIAVIRRKVALEIASLPPNVEYANYAANSGAPRNCSHYGAK